MIQTLDGKTLMNKRKKKHILSRLLAKPVPERYSLTAPPEILYKYDWIAVNGSTTEHNDVLLRGIDCANDEITYFYWDKESPESTAQEAKCALDDILWDTLSASHTFRSWRVKYDTLHEAYIHDLLNLQKAKWLLQGIRDRLIRPIKPNYRIQLLSHIVDLHNSEKPIHHQSLLVKTYGGGILLSKDNYRYYKELNFMINSLVQSGDIIERNQQNEMDFLGEESTIRPLPQALETLANYEVEEARHRDMVSLSRAQIFLGIAMFALAAATLYLQLYER